MLIGFFAPPICSSQRWRLSSSVARKIAQIFFTPFPKEPMHSLWLSQKRFTKVGPSTQPHSDLPHSLTSLDGPALSGGRRFRQRLPVAGTISAIDHALEWSLDGRGVGEQLQPLSSGQPGSLGRLYAICCDGRQDTAHVRKRGVVLWDWLPTSWPR
jgi:hypothetical protein